MSGRRFAARVAAVLAAALGGAVGGAASVPAIALADVTVTPSTGVQGEALKLVFRISEDRPPAYTVKVELHLPEATPIAEVYPLSVEDWAPRIAMRTLDQPIESLHSGELTEVVSSITWIRVTEGKSTPPELAIALGPLPGGDQLAFTVVQTYSDGVRVRSAGAPVVRLRPPAPNAGHADPAADYGPVTGSAVLYPVLVAAVAAGILCCAWILVRRRP